MKQSELLSSFGYNPNEWVILTKETIDKFELPTKPLYQVHSYGIVSGLGKKEFGQDSRIVKKEFILKNYPDFDFESNLALNELERSLSKNTTKKEDTEEASKESVSTEPQPQSKTEPPQVDPVVSQEKESTEEEKQAERDRQQEIYSQRSKLLTALGMFFDFRVLSFVHPQSKDLKIHQDDIFKMEDEAFETLTNNIQVRLGVLTPTAETEKGKEEDPLTTKEAFKPSVDNVVDTTETNSIVPENTTNKDEAIKEEDVDEPDPKEEVEEIKTALPEKIPVGEPLKKDNLEDTNKGLFHYFNKSPFEQLNISLNKFNNKEINVIVRVSNFSLDKAFDNLPPISIKATPEELDASFVSLIANPISQAASAMSSADEFIKALEAAKKKTKAKEETQKKIKDALEKANKFYQKEDFDLNKSGNTAIKKYNEVLSLDPDNIDAKSKIEEIENKLKESQNKLV